MRHLGTLPSYAVNGKYTITKTSGCIVTRTNDYRAALEFANVNDYTVCLSR